MILCQLHTGIARIGHAGAIFEGIAQHERHTRTEGGVSDASACHIYHSSVIVGRGRRAQHEHVAVEVFIFCVGGLIQGEILLYSHVEPLADCCSIGCHMHLLFASCSCLVYTLTSSPCLEGQGIPLLTKGIYCFNRNRVKGSHLVTSSIPSTVRYRKPCGQNVSCSVDIPIVPGSTTGTHPLPHV